MKTHNACFRLHLVCAAGVWLGLSLPGNTLAQAPADATTSSFATSLSIPAAASALPVSMPLPPVAGSSVSNVSAVLVGCRPVSDKAMAADMAAVTAQSKKADLNEQAKLFTEAVVLWSQAAQQCDGRAKDRAVRSRDDDQQVLHQITEALGSGPYCASGQKDAASLQDMAKQALTERRWADAASLFRKAENMWDDVAERCTGSQQEQAHRRREQSAQDGHNAQFCAPLFEVAREQTQKLRSAAATLAKEDKQDASMAAETLWRDALENCKGAAVQEIAANNAKALARERGTPWVPRLAAAAQSGLAATAKPPMGSLGAGKPTGATAALSLVPSMTPPANGMVNTTPAQNQKASEGLKPAEPAAQTPGVLMAGTTRFTGQFARDADATSISGTGKVAWATGDVFEGTLVKGLRHGKGSIVWANGQRYTGDWVMDKPTGLAKMHFANGNDYEGDVVDGLPQGAGHMRYASGDVFDGQFRNGEPHERGIYVWRNGQQYDGAWRNGRPNGQGKLRFATGNLYEGTVVDGVPQGQGRMVFVGGEVYVGQFLAGEPDGEGTFNWPSGDQYAGQWKAGKKHGKGVFTWKAGERWEGIYDNDAQKN